METYYKTYTKQQVIDLGYDKFDIAKIEDIDILYEHIGKNPASSKIACFCIYYKPIGSYKTYVYKCPYFLGCSCGPEDGRFRDYFNASDGSDYMLRIMDLLDVDRLSMLKNKTVKVLSRSDSSHIFFGSVVRNEFVGPLLDKISDEEIEEILFRRNIDDIE
jgi:hypothetical protein